MALLPRSSSSSWEGVPAPHFELRNERGEPVTLAQLLTKGPVLLAFYPVDFGLVCTRQLCSYQEAIDRFMKYGVQVVGVSFNSPESHRKFKEQYRLTFPLLSDPDKATFKIYGVTSLFMLGGTSRAIFIISRQGKVLYRHVEPTTVTHRKAGELLEILDGLRNAGAL